MNFLIENKALKSIKKLVLIKNKNHIFFHEKNTLIDFSRNNYKIHVRLKRNDLQKS